MGIPQEKTVTGIPQEKTVMEIPQKTVMGIPQKTVMGIPQEKTVMGIPQSIHHQRRHGTNSDAWEKGNLLKQIAVGGLYDP